MRKSLLAIAMVLSLLMSAVASAQSVHIRVMVPFNFIVAGKTLPAGAYDIQSLGAEEKLLAFRNFNSSAGLLTSSNSCESLNASASTKLVFHRYGDRYFLSELWVQGQRSGHQVMPASREKEVAMDYPRDKDEVVFSAGR